MESNKKPRRNRVPLVLPLAHSTAHHEVPKKHNLSLAGSCRKKYHETSVARHERRSFQQRTTLSYNRPNSHDKACQTNTLLVNEIVRDKPGIEETTGIQNVIGELRDILETSSQNDCAENHLDYDLDIQYVCERVRNENLKANSFLDEKNARVIRRCFLAWKEATLFHKRNLLHNKVESTEYFKSKKKGILAVLSAVAIGANSKKNILQRRQNALDQARGVLMKKLAEKSQSHGIITMDMLQIELRRIFHNELHKWDRKRYLSGPFVVMKELMIEANIGNKKARDYAKTRYLKLPFEGWRNVSLTQLASHAKVDIFAKKSLPIMVLKSWHRLARTYSIAAQKRRAFLTQIATDCFTAWLFQAKVNKPIRVRVIGQWTNYRQTIARGRFQKWRQWAAYKRDILRDRGRFLYAHKRLREGRLLLRFFRNWKHFISYGRVSGLYSRSDLFDLLEEKSRQLETLRSAGHKDTCYNATLGMEEQLRQKHNEVERLSQLLKESQSQNEERCNLLNTLESNQDFRTMMESLVSRQTFCARW